MYLKLDEKELKIIEKLTKLTSTNYELVGDMFPCDSFLSAIENLMFEYDYLQEKYDDLERNYWELVSGEHYEDLS